MERYSRKLLADREPLTDIADEARRSGWMGFEPASAAEIMELESRIGVELPNSYKQFLATTNGWRQTGPIYEIYPCEKVEWFCENNQDWIDIWVESDEDDPIVTLEEHCDYGEDQDSCYFRRDYLQSALQISGIGDGAVLLLNPEIKTLSGEWEAWCFANYLPGASRYRSFWELMQSEYDSFVYQLEYEDKRYFPEDGIETLYEKLPNLITEIEAQERRYGTVLKSRDDSQRMFNDYTNGIIDALVEARLAVMELEEMQLPSNDLLNKLRTLANDYESQWKSRVTSNPYDFSNSRGRGEGCRQVFGFFSWFLDLPVQ